MPSPFPGMNPYLENPELWTEVHHLLMGILAETLNPQLLPKYRAAIEKRVYQMNGEDALFVGIPDVTVEHSRSISERDSRTDASQNSSNVAVAPPPATPVTVTVPMPIEFREGYLEIREVVTKEVVTVIEILSPTNKRPGKGREAYEEKRREVLGSRTHLVEIDLLRGGEPMPVSGSVQGNYRILVSRGDRPSGSQSPTEGNPPSGLSHRPRAELYAFNIKDAIPTFSLPLRSPDVEPTIDLYSLLNLAYDRAGYSVVIDYNRRTVPALSEADATWVDVLLRQKGSRIILYLTSLPSSIFPTLWHVSF